jgi:hypothetical protein
MRLAEAWPRGTKFEQRSFELLRRAYVDARYSPHYKINAEELAWLEGRVTAGRIDYRTPSLQSNRAVLFCRIVSDDRIIRLWASRTQCLR